MSIIFFKIIIEYDGTGMFYDCFDAEPGESIIPSAM